MRDVYQIILSPRITEKGTFLSEKQNQYVFEVARDANKIEIRKAVEKIWKKKVVKVRTLATHPKKYRSRWGKYTYGPKVKKAIVTLAEGEKLDFGV
ncbi:50S ribosomal protein L23 [Candidatus Methylacidithermus pantelleriae]|uniref:Large ribosomal subunit protein uL23 n=1 Tax=Candidatus Methylacidithermus pantelleriae TaxID=2744239 RepID=A0A8J2BPD1_9BACT|nr:50S ribosomal protein L23 [Candidatus Methylacidithermus pantelleriae]CAF0698841.1 50S ribosomal protein L23 [Candidatus Methylacidithermus pantelleriae]